MNRSPVVRPKSPVLIPVMTISRCPAAAILLGFLHQIGDRHIAAGAPRIVDRTVGALIVAAVLHFQERTGTVAARKSGEEIGQFLHIATGELCGSLASKSRYTPEKFALVVVAQHQIDPFDRSDLLRFELGIATGDDNNRRRVAPMDFTDQVTAFLVGMFGHRATVDDRNIRRFRNPDLMKPPASNSRARVELSEKLSLQPKV